MEGLRGAREGGWGAVRDDELIDLVPEPELDPALGHGRADPAAHLAADVALVVDDARYGLDGDAGEPGDVDDRAL